MTPLDVHLRQMLTILILLTVPFTTCLAQQETLRANVLGLLQATQELGNQKKYSEATTRFEELDALGQVNSLEVFTIERMRAVLQIGLGNTQAAVKALEKAIQTGRGTIADRLALMENLTLIQYGEKAFGEAAHWAGRYIELGGKSEQLQLLQVQALYLSGQFAPAVRLLIQRTDVDLTAQRRPEELQLRLLASAQHQLNDGAGYVATLERLAGLYPTPEIWSDLLYRLMKRKDFPASLEIDVRRLMRVVAAESRVADYLEYAQLAIMAGFPNEASQVLGAAKDSGKLSEKADAENFTRMLAQSTRLQLEDEKLLPEEDAQFVNAHDGDPLVNMGLNLVFSGQHERGVEMISKGLKKGGLKQPQATRLRLAYAFYLTGQAGKATKAFETFNGQTAEDALARLWLIQLKQNSQ